MQATVESVEVMVQDLPAVWDGIRSLAQKAFTGESMVAAALISATLAGAGILQYTLYRALENWTITGCGVASFGFF